MNLSWLRAPPDNFEDELEKSQDNPHALHVLSLYRLDERKLNKLMKKMDLYQSIPSNFQHLKLAIFSDANPDYVIASLRATGLRYGLWIDIKSSAFSDNVHQVTNKDSEIFKFNPDFGLISYHHHNLEKALTDIDSDKAKIHINHTSKEINLIAKCLKGKLQAQPIVQTLPPPTAHTFGSLDKRISGTVVHAINELNKCIWEGDGTILDIESLANTVGLSNWHDPEKYYWAKIPFSPKFLPLYADHVCRTISACIGKSKKCLAIDLDNTLWGGVIGDDGLDGIDLGENSPLGEAFLSVQRTCLKLKNRGIILSVISKNDDENARLPFREHPEQILKEDHITVFQANWQDKPSNIRAVAKQLNIGLDSIVFLDDNPAERDFVRRELPEVAVPEIPNDNPSSYPDILSAAGYFEAISFTETDKNRARDYKANSKRIELLSDSSDIDTYLKSLKMELDFLPFDVNDKNRITQLINRSNQFNLTTIRTTEAEIESLMINPEYQGFTVRLKDVFGDTGIIAILICKNENDNVWNIHTWLMSCRVLGRKVEEATLLCLIKAAKKRHKKLLRGSYIPTSKNSLVEHHYKTLGFNQAPSPKGQTCWELPLEGFTIDTRSLPFTFTIKN